MVGNEKAKLVGLKGNRHINESVYAGTSIIIGDDGQGGFMSLTEEQSEAYSEMFAEPEEISDDEVESDILPVFDQPVITSNGLLSYFCSFASLHPWIFSRKSNHSGLSRPFNLLKKRVLRAIPVRMGNSIPPDRFEGHTGDSTRQNPGFSVRVSDTCRKPPHRVSQSGGRVIIR